jgi:sugar lactone lactonase YvrE
MLTVLLACAGPVTTTSSPTTPAPAPAPAPAPVPTTSTTGDTASTPTGDTGGATEPPLDCTVLPPVPVAVTTVGTYSTSEDFDIDGDGYVGVVYQGNLVRKDYYGVSGGIVGPNVGAWTSGTRVLSTGDWVIADSGTGSLVRVDAATGAQTSLASSLTWPNGVEVGEDDQLFVTDFSTGRVFRIDAYDPSDYELVGEGLDQANGVVLSPDELTLYVIESWTAAVVAFDKDPVNGTWSGPRLIHYQAGGDFQGLNADACGNLYVTDARVSADSPILRISPDGAVVETLAVLPTGYPPNLRFGSGVGGWGRDVLYVSDRDQGRLFALEAGIVGKTPVWE